MLKKVNFKSLHDDLRKIGITFIIGAITGVFINPHSKWIPLSILAILGLFVWWLGLNDGEKDDRY